MGEAEGPRWDRGSRGSARSSSNRSLFALGSVRSWGRIDVPGGSGSRARRPPRRRDASPRRGSVAVMRYAKNAPGRPSPARPRRATIGATRPRLVARRERLGEDEPHRVVLVAHEQRSPFVVVDHVVGWSAHRSESARVRVAARREGNEFGHRCRLGRGDDASTDPTRSHRIVEERAMMTIGIRVVPGGRPPARLPEPACGGGVPRACPRPRAGQGVGAGGVGACVLPHRAASSRPARSSSGRSRSTR